MEYTNDSLAELISSLDPSAEWAFNKHCQYCGRFLYPEETVACKKCGTAIKSPVTRPLPFLTSATAIEKLLLWLRGFDRPTLKRCAEIITLWAESDRSADSYRLEIVIACVNALLLRRKAIDNEQQHGD